MTRKILLILATLSTLLPGILSCEHLGRVITNAGHSYRNDQGLVVKYTGLSQNFNDTVRQRSIPPFQKLEAKHGLRVEWVAATEPQIVVLGGYDQAGKVQATVEDGVLTVVQLR